MTNRKEKRDKRKTNRVTSYKKAWMEERANELNTDIHPSEQWFIDKFAEKDINIRLTQNFCAYHYIIDFRFQELAIEVDGSIHDKPEQKEKDLIKDRNLKAIGFKVIRIKAYDEMSFNIAICKIKQYLSIPKEDRKNRVTKLIKRLRKAEKTGLLPNEQNKRSQSSNGIRKKKSKSKGKKKSKKFPTKQKGNTNRVTSCMGCHKSKAKHKVKFRNENLKLCDSCYNRLEIARKTGLI